MTEPPTGTILIVSRSSTHEDIRHAGELASALAARLGHVFELCVAEGPGEPVAAGIRSLVASGARRLVMVSLSWSPERPQRSIPLEIQWASRRWPFLTFHAAAPFTWLELTRLLNESSRDSRDGLTDAALELMVAHCQAALEDDSLLAPSWDQVLTDIARNAGADGHGRGRELAAEEEAQLQELDRRINELLPPQYEGRYDEVSTRSMGASPLQFDGVGRVAWNQMWTTFCDLALAGGPPHRGMLLEAITAAEALAEPEKYQAVVAEIGRGIKIVTGLPVVPSKTPGWVGIRCDSDEMAVWLMRAIIVENVMIRREGDVIYLPAGPRFTLKGEIKNVVTVVAKTCHYWTAHLTKMARA